MGAIARYALPLIGIAAAAYTGGASMGLLGAGEGVGAIAGSEAAANAVGMAGGDALGSLIASNAASWGVTVAPEIAATGMSAGAGILSSLKTASTVLAPVASIVSSMGQVEATKRMGNITNMPTVPTMPVMPIAGGQASFNAQQASFASQLQRRGRASTILTGPSDDRLGG